METNQLTAFSTIQALMFLEWMLSPGGCSGVFLVSAEAWGFGFFFEFQRQFLWFRLSKQLPVADSSRLLLREELKMELGAKLKFHFMPFDYLKLDRTWSAQAHLSPASIFPVTVVKHSNISHRPYIRSANFILPGIPNPTFCISKIGLLSLQNPTCSWVLQHVLQMCFCLCVLIFGPVGCWCNLNKRLNETGCPLSLITGSSGHRDCLFLAAVTLV